MPPPTSKMYYLIGRGFFYEYQFGKKQDKTNRSGSAGLDSVCRDSRDVGCASDRSPDAGQQMDRHRGSRGDFSVCFFGKSCSVSRSKKHTALDEGAAALAGHLLNASHVRLSVRRKLHVASRSDPYSGMQSSRQSGRHGDWQTGKKENREEKVHAGK